MASQGNSTANHRRRGTLALAVLGAIVVVLVAAAYVYAQSRSDSIAAGVRVGGVAVGGLDRGAATRRVTRRLERRLGRGVPVVYRARRWNLRVVSPALRAHVEAAVTRALAISREGSFLSQAQRGLLGEKLNRSVPVALTLPASIVGAFAAKVAGAVDRAPVDATVAPEGERLVSVRGKDGLSVRRRDLGRQLRAWLAAGGGAAVVVPVARTSPQVTLRELAKRYPAYIVVDRSHFRLRFYNHLKLEHSYEIAVGMQGLETPPGLYHVQWKQVNPPWYVPKSAWAGALAGKVIPPGPEDPLKARFMSFDGGAGIHGIDPSEYWSIGHYASHGCVRMRIPDVISLYAKTPVGTPVYIY